MGDLFRASISCISLKFRDNDMESRFKQYQIAQSVPVARTVFIFSIIYMGAIAITYYMEMQTTFAEIKLTGIAGSILCLVLSVIFPSVTPYLGNFYMLIYFNTPLLYHIHDVEWVLLYFLEGTCFMLLFTTLIDRFWFFSTIEYTGLCFIYVIANSHGFEEHREYVMTISLLIPFILFQLIVMSYGCQFFRRKFFHQNCASELSSKQWLSFLLLCPDPICIVSSH